MRKERGITLVSLIIYITLMCLVIATLSIVSDLFYSNTKYIKDNSKNISEYNKFNMYFIDDVKNNKNTYQVTDDTIIFEDGTIYTYKADIDNSIYRNRVKICQNIAYCNFSESEQIVNNTTKSIIKVHMVIDGSKLFETVNEYVLKYW